VPFALWWRWTEAVEAKMVSKDFNLRALKAIPLLSGLSDQDLELLRPGIKVLRKGPGEVVLREGDAAERLFVLVNGEVQVVKNYLEPGAQTLDVLRAGAFFGEMALVGEGGKRSATVVTTEESYFITLDREGFKAALALSSEMAFAVISEAFRRLRQANDLIATLQRDQ
jgi:CRP-like cAMP-binding protein